MRRKLRVNDRVRALVNAAYKGLVGVIIEYRRAAFKDDADVVVVLWGNPAGTTSIWRPWELAKIP